MVDEQDDDNLDKTSIMPSETLKVRLEQAGQAPPTMVMLVGPAESVGRQWQIEETDRIVGRSVNSHIFVDDKSVSKSHSKIVFHLGDVAIMDLESTNKTLINGQMIDPLTPIILKNNDQVKMGNVIFKFLEKGNVESLSVAETYDRGTRDALTGCNNKGALMVKGGECFKKSDLLNVPLSVITFDIDHFKKINDTYGHAAGDFVLIELVKTVSNNVIREGDFFSRSGGEEFTLLLLGSNLKQATDVAERIRSTIEQFKFEFDSKVLPITVSLGVSQKTESDTIWEEIFERADAALYESKNSGRNKVTAQAE